jgi:hypothetical protein
MDEQSVHICWVISVHFFGVMSLLFFLLFILCSDFQTLHEQAIVTHLQDHQVSLPQDFGTYNLTSWKFLPPSRW